MKNLIYLALISLVLSGCTATDLPPTNNEVSGTKSEYNKKQVPLEPKQTKENVDEFNSVAEEKIPQPEGKPTIIPEPKQKTKPEPKPDPIPEPTPVPTNCHPNYSGCLRADASDYDCAGGSGNGPYYTGKVKVIGLDIFGLDRDNDGWGCE